MSCRLYMCCHKTYSEIPPLCVPIQGGRAINPPIDGIRGDNSGDNISEKNREYCELTVQYYAWKNDDSDYVGFCHYRRFFCFDERQKKPYIAVGSLSEKQKARLLGSAELINRLCGEYDIIVPRAENMGLSVREHYLTSPHHFKEDMELFLSVLSEKYPVLVPHADEYLGQERQYFCNMFIMDRKHFHEYCALLFGILEEFDKRKTIHGDFQSDRTDGYLAERFLGIYLSFARENGAAIKEISRVDAGCSLGKRAGVFLFPPESRRRFLVKKLVKKIKG